MRRFLRVAIPFICLFSIDVMARDTTLNLSISDAMVSSAFKEKLNPNIKFLFGKQAYPAPVSIIGEFVTNKKTNAFAKTDVHACQWVFLSALISLQDRALSEGGSAVVDIVSYYKRREFSSETQYECHVGAIIAGVALKGRVVTLP